MPTYKPYGQIDESHVVNIFAYSGTFPVNKGTFVKILGSGFMPTQELEMLGAPGAAFANTVSQRYGTVAKVGACTASGDKTAGFLLYDGRETDENGEKLIYRPQKAAEMEVFVSGQTAPICRRATLLYSGVAGTPTPGDYVTLGNDGGLSVSGVGVATKVGQFLGGKDANGFVLVQIDVN